jgi:(acyl-carrier-protein) S-malonyltransferase
MTSVIFPGQGSQYLGMTKDFYDNFKEFKDVFLEIEDNTKLNLKKIIFSDDPNLLNTTNYTQISIF